MISLKNLVDEEKVDLISNYENGTLIDYLSERVLEVKRNEETNELEYLVFTMGGPHIELDMGIKRTGCVCGYSGTDKKAFSTIPYDKWTGIELEILETFNN